MTNYPIGVSGLEPDAPWNERTYTLFSDLDLVFSISTVAPSNINNVDQEEVLNYLVREIDNTVDKIKEFIDSLEGVELDIIRNTNQNDEVL